MEEEISTITAGSLILTLCLGILLLLLPRRYALVPLMVSGCYMTLGQILLIGPLHFTVFRLLLLFGWIRITINKEIFSIKLNSIDKVLMAWIFISSLLNLFLRGGSSEAIINRLGVSYNAIGVYFLIRALVWDFDDIVHAVKMLGVIIIPLAFLFAVEKTTGKNIFSILGGVPEFTDMRNNRLRCQGPFRHPILAGTFGATAMPLFAGLWFHGLRARLLAAGAAVAATIIVIASSSSGPLLAYLMGTVGLSFWAFRSNMRAVRWGIVFLLVALHVYMKAPVWFLIARLGDVVGGGGWHRAALIDAAIRHFNEWWLIGTTYTAHWMPTTLAISPNSADLTNQFISEGANGGILSMCLFIWLIVKCFKTIGDAAHYESQLSNHDQFMIWSLGCALLGHVISFFSVTYFDQIIIFWYMVIAMTAALVQANESMQTVVIVEFQ